MLQFLLIDQRPHQSRTFPLFEVGSQQSTNTVLLLYIVRKTLLRGQRPLQIILGSDRLPLTADELQREVPHDPKESREVPREFLRILIHLIVCVELNALGEVDNQT
jgi:hypothetical protein